MTHTYTSVVRQNVFMGENKRTEKRVYICSLSFTLTTRPPKKIKSTKSKIPAMVVNNEENVPLKLILFYVLRA